MVGGPQAQQLAHGDAPRLGLVLQAPTPTTVELLGRLRSEGLSFVMIDGQHEPLGPTDLAHLLRAAAINQLPTLVRVGVGDERGAALALDLGAAGIVFPGVDSRGDAERAVAACRYPPIGRRSLGGTRNPVLAQRRVDAVQPLCIVQIESKEALEQLDAILAVAHLDGVFPGQGDLALSLGLDVGDLASATAATAGDLSTIAKQAAANGVAYVTYCASPSDVADAGAAGASWILVGMDVPLLMAGARDTLVAAHSILTNR